MIFFLIERLSLFDTIKMNIFNIIGSGDLERIKQWLTTDPDINKKYNHGYTPINHASLKGHIEIVKLLLAQ
jgi:ankyrin repeat protein